MSNQKQIRPMMRPVTRQRPTTCGETKTKSSASRVQKHRLNKALQPGYDHEEVKRQTRERVAAIRARKQKCPLGRKCKDLTCNLHPDRGRNRIRERCSTKKDMGELKRRQYRRSMQNDNNLLAVKVSLLTNENRRLKRKMEKVNGTSSNNTESSEQKGDNTETSGQESNNTESDSEIDSASFIIQNMTPNSKRKTFQRMASTPGFTLVKKNLRKNSNIRVHNTRLFTPINMSLSSLGEKIMVFMMNDDNSFECPDKKKENVRYRRDNLDVLHKKFMGEENVECSYRHFCRYVPEQIVKPKPEDWGTSLCKMCINPELKAEGLKNSVGTEINIDNLVSLNQEELNELKENLSTDTLVTYKEWQKEPVKKMKKATKPNDQQNELTVKTKTYRSVKVIVTEKSKEFVKKLLTEVEILKKHNEIKISQFRRIKAIRKLVDDPENNAIAIHMDWSENATLFQCRQEKSAYYHDKQISVNTAVVYTADETKCVGSLSDNTDHSAAAVWTSFNSMMEALEIKIGELKKLFIITDSPGSQYRNKTCAYLTKKCAEENGVEITWVFTESGHGKGPMDGVGATIKNSIDDVVIASESMPDVCIRSCMDIFPILNLPNITISTYDDESIATMTKKIPNNLIISWKKFGISKVHEIRMSSSSSNIIEWKMVSQDETYTKAMFLTKAKKRTLLKKNVEVRKEKVDDGDDEVGKGDDSDDDGNDEEVGDCEGDKNDGDDESEEEDSEEVVSVVDASISAHPDVNLVTINFEDVQLNSWVLVIYEEEKFLGKVLAKGATKVKVQCLTKPYGIPTAQEFEKDAIYYDEVFEAPVIPWATELDDDGKLTRKTFYKY